MEEGLARENGGGSASSHRHRNLASSFANGEHRRGELELELPQNGAANTEHHHVPENPLLLDSSKVGALKRRQLLDNLLKNVQDDHLPFLLRQRERIDRVGVKLPAVEVRYNNLSVQAECRTSTNGNHLPSLWNSTKGFFLSPLKLLGLQTQREKISILEDKISGVPKAKNNCNPATWMMNVTSTSVEVQHNINFAVLYEESSLHSGVEQLVETLSTPIPNSENLCFSHRFPQNGWTQLKACLWKQNITYWRSPQYNLRRIMMTVISALIYGVLFWKHAKILNNEQDLFNIFGAMYLGATTVGSYNHQSIIPFTATERIVMYREKFAGMYSSWSYSFAQAAIEIPYVFIQVLLYTLIVYPLTGYYWTAHKFLWFFYATFCSMLSYVYVGLLLVSITPNVQVATILASFFNTMQTLFSGFILPAPKIPKWWIWLYYLTPTSWTLNALLTSQYGNIEKQVEIFGEANKSVSVFLNDYFGFHQNKLSLVAAILVAFPFVLIILFSLSVEKFNFQKR